MTNPLGTTHPTQNTTMSTPTTPTTPDQLLDYWPGDIPFKGNLVSDDGTCMCAHGQALHFLDGVSPAELRDYDQVEADKRVAELFGISRAHSVLLRLINDGRPGAPSVVIRDPTQVLGGQAETVLAFWRHLDRMTPQQWEATAARAVVVAAMEAPWATAAGVAARNAAATASAAGAAAAAATRSARAAWAPADALWASADAAWAAARATNEIQGAAVLRAQGRPFYFLPMFGIAQPEDLIVSNEVKP